MISSPRSLSNFLEKEQIQQQQPQTVQEVIIHMAAAPCFVQGMPEGSASERISYYFGTRSGESNFSQVNMVHFSSQIKLQHTSISSKVDSDRFD